MSQPAPVAFQFEHGAGTTNAVEVRVRGLAGGGGQSDNGGGQEGAHWILKGPYCQLTRMLPATFRLQESPDGSVWSTTVVDPCYWTPSLPAYYRLHCLDEEGSELPESKEVGLRRLEVRRGQLWLDGRRWVFRGVWRPTIPDACWGEFAEALLGLASRGRRRSAGGAGNQVGRAAAGPPSVSRL